MTNRRRSRRPDPPPETAGRSDGTHLVDGPGGDAGFGLVEALIAFVILAVGLMAVAGIALSVAAQTRGAASTTARSLAGQQVLEVTASASYSSVPAGTKDTTITVGNRSFTVTRTVEQTSSTTKKVTVEVPDSEDQSTDTMVTYLAAPRGLPPAP